VIDRCNMNRESFSYLGPLGGAGAYGEGVTNNTILFGSQKFRVLEYEVYQVKLHGLME
jgi:hypothetical protein